MSIKIVPGRRGYYLKVDGLFLSHDFNNHIRMIKNNHDKAPYGATEWTSVDVIRDYWEKFRKSIIEGLKNPYESKNGELIKIK